jgi:DNA-binding IclR family transcriptional regulator
MAGPETGLETGISRGEPGGNDEPFEESSESRIPTNMRTLLLLEIIGRSRDALSPTEVNQQLGLPKQTVHRLCNSLVDDGFLIRTGKKLRPSRRTRQMASGLLNSSRVHIGRHQILSDVAQAVGETVNFVVPEDDGMNYLDRVETDWPFRVQLPIGTHVPFHCTASGKTFLASLPARHRQKLVQSLKLERSTANTITSHEALLTELANIGRNGYATDREEFMEGMVAIAVPVLDEQGGFAGALAYHGPSLRLDLNVAIKNRGILLEASGKLTSILFD